MVAPKFIFKSENILISSLGTVFTHGLIHPNGTSLTPANSFGETRIVPRSLAVNSNYFLSLSDSVTVTVQATSNNVLVDVICQQYHSIIR